MKYQRGLVLGRFQPFHKGHQHLIDKALEECETLVIAVGSANMQDEKNPFTFEERREKIQEALSQTAYGGRIAAVVPLDDNPDDDVWLRELLRKAGPLDVVYGNNEWPNGIFEKAGYTVVRVPLYKRHIYEGTKIRKRMGV